MSESVTRSDAIALVAAALYGATRGAPPSAGPFVAFVYTQAAGDNGVMDDMIAGLKQLTANAALMTRFIYASDPTTYQPILQLLGEAGAAVVLATFSEMGEPLKAVAPLFPRTRFVQIYGDPVHPPVPNLRTIEYDAYVVGFLIGIFAGFISRGDKIGYVAGVDIPSIDAVGTAIIAGAKTIKPEMSIVPTFVGSFQDPAKAFQIAEQLFRSSVNFVHMAAAGSDVGVIQSANSKLGRLVSGESAQAFGLGPASVASILLLDFGKSVRDQTALALERTWHGGHYHSGLQDGVVDFIPSTTFLQSGPADEAASVRKALPHIQGARKRILDGQLRVPYQTQFQ